MKDMFGVEIKVGDTVCCATDGGWKVSLHRGVVLSFGMSSPRRGKSRPTIKVEITVLEDGKFRTRKRTWGHYGGLERRLLVIGHSDD